MAILDDLKEAFNPVDIDRGRLTQEIPDFSFMSELKTYEFEFAWESTLLFIVHCGQYVETVSTPIRDASRNFIQAPGEFENMEKRRGERKRKLAVGFAILIAFSSVLFNQAAATDGDLNLPSAPIRIEVSDGMGSYFSTKLSDVPPDYDVTNGTYLGWCVDVRTEMPRSPTTHAVILYSSISPPGELAGERWDLVNYILNHKQGTVQDIQQSIWYFIRMDGKYVPTSNQAWNIINETLASGDGFVPEDGQIVAVICFPVVLHPELNSVQISIIEVQNAVIPEFPVFLILPLFVVATLSAIAVYRRKPPVH